MAGTSALGPLALRELATPASTPAAGTRYLYLKSDGLLYTKNSAAIEAAVSGTATAGGPLATAVTNTSANSVYPDNTSYFRYSLTTEGFVVNGMLSGIRIGTNHTQRLQDATSGSTYARNWNEGTTSWGAWSIYLDAQDFTAKGDTHFATGNNAVAVLPVGANNAVMTADSTTATGVKWATNVETIDTPQTITGLKTFTQPVSAAELVLTTEYTNTKPVSPAAGVTLYTNFKARRLPKIVGPNGQDATLQPNIFSNRIHMWRADNGVTGPVATNTSGLTLSGATSAAVSVAPGSFYNMVIRTRGTTAATAGSGAGWRLPPMFILSSTANMGGFFFVHRFGVFASTATSRLFVGMSSTNAFVNPAVDPTTLFSYVGFVSNSADANISFSANAATGTAYKVDLGANFPSKTAATYIYEARLWSASGSGQTINWSLERLNDGLLAQGAVSAVVKTGYVTTAQIPAVDTLLGPQTVISNGTTAAAASYDFTSLYIETDN